MKHRNHEALSVLTKINYHSNTEYFVDTCMELEDLRNTTSIDTSKTLKALRKFFKLKYLRRYYLCTFSVKLTIVFVLLY